jgi:N4-gp56 family major capsid protein
MAFPSDVTMQSSTSAAIAATNVVTYYEKVGLERLLPRLRYVQAGDKKPLPKRSGRTVQWYRFRVRAAVTTNLTEMTVPSRGTISADSISATLIQRGGYVAFSDMVSLTAIDPMVEDAAALMGEEAARSIDRYVRDKVTFNVSHDVQAKSSVVHGAATYRTSGAGQRVWSGITPYTGGTWEAAFPMLHNKLRILQSALVSSFAASALTLRTIQHAAAFLESNNADTFSDGKFLGIIHPDNKYSIMTAAGFKTWNSYTTPELMYKGEIGEIANTRFLMSSDAPKILLSGDTSGETATTSGWIYGTLIVGAGAYAVTEVDGGFKVFVNEAGSAGAADPIQQINTAGWKWTGVARVLNKSAGVCVLSTNTTSLGC